MRRDLNPAIVIGLFAALCITSVVLMRGSTPSTTNDIIAPTHIRVLRFVDQADGSIKNTDYTYNGTAPIRMLTFAEYNFIRAEAAVYGATGDAEAFYQAGIRASMSAAGVPTAQIDAYIAANGSLTGTEAEKVRKIIEEKFVANYGVVMEPWTDWRRTGFPAISAPTNALFATTPRSLYYPQVEIDLNNNAPSQKADLSERVFWDVQ